MAKEKERELARILYVEQGKTAQEIAPMLDVSQTTLSAWVNRYGWKGLRAAKVNVPIVREDNIKQIINDESERRLGLSREERAAKETGDHATAADLRKQIAAIDDGISKHNKVLENIRREGALPLHLRIRAIDDLHRYIKERDIGLYIALVPLLLDYNATLTANHS